MTLSILEFHLNVIHQSTQQYEKELKYLEYFLNM
jgi:hypothetical protein